MRSVFSVYSGEEKRTEGHTSCMADCLWLGGVREEVLDTAEQQNCDKRGKRNSLIEFVESQSHIFTLNKHSCMNPNSHR